MNFSFDPRDKAQCDTAMQVISLFHTEVTPLVTAGNVAPVAETPAPVAETPAPAGTGTADNPDPNSPDVHGMVWSEDYHSKPPTRNADGSWRASRKAGAKEALAAAIEAAKAGTGTPAPVAETPAPVAAPAPIAAPAPAPVANTAPPAPAAPAPTTPAAPITYEAMGSRLHALMGSGVVADYAQAYADLGIDHSQLQTNQTFVERLWMYMDALEAGHDHAGAVQHGMSRG